MWPVKWDRTSYYSIHFCQAQSQLQLSWTELALISTFPHPPPGKVPWRTFQACGTILDSWQVVQDQFDHAKFVHATSVHATFVHATFVHATFVPGQNLVVYNCNHSSLDQTIKFKTSRRAKPNLGQFQLILSLAQLSPRLFLHFSKISTKSVLVFHHVFNHLSSLPSSSIWPIYNQVF